MLRPRFTDWCAHHAFLVRDGPMCRREEVRVEVTLDWGGSEDEDAEVTITWRTNEVMRGDQR